MALRIKVTGRVQGVFFRATTKEKADELGVKGWVRNEPDGSVLIEAEGEEDRLSEFKEWCIKGPAAARVDRVHANKIATRDYSNFEVVY